MVVLPRALCQVAHLKGWTECTYTREKKKQGNLYDIGRNGRAVSANSGNDANAKKRPDAKPTPWEELELTCNVNPPMQGR
jgi:hypothetical protein